MASKKKTVAQIGLAAIVAAMSGSPGYAMVPKAEAERLASEGLVELNNAIVDGDKIATRATQKGIDSVNQTENKSDAAEAAPAKIQFVIEDNVALPAIVGRGRTGSAYPFDKLNVGQSFFVPKPAKNLASTVSTANARYAVEEKDEAGNVLTRTDRKGNVVPKTKQTRTFAVRTVEGGSRIWRTA